MKKKKCTCGVVIQVGIWDGVTSSEGCPMHSENHLKDLIVRIETLEIGQGDLYRRIGQGDNTEKEDTL